MDVKSSENSEKLKDVEFAQLKDLYMWHEWNVNTNDVMMMWFALYVNLVTSHQACMTCVHVHGTHALCKSSASKYLSDLVCMQADPNLAKITTSQFWVLSTQNAN